jgi:predicted DNA-binding antitoxin AbrB/MazE fold protein
MPKSVKVTYEDGVFKPLQKVNLKEHQKFELIIKEISIKAPSSSKQNSPLRLIGLFESEIDDLSLNHDSYLYKQIK